MTRRGLPRGSLAALVVTLAAAGCLEDPSPGGPLPDGGVPPMSVSSFGTGAILASARGCIATNAIAPYPGSGSYPDGFVTEDISGEFPDAAYGKVGGSPVDSAFGGYVSFATCADGPDTSRSPFLGFIGQRMKAWPADGGAAVHRTFLWQPHHNFAHDDRFRAALAETMGGEVLPFESGAASMLEDDLWRFSFFTQPPDGNAHTADGAYEGELYAPATDRAPPGTSRVWSRIGEDDQGKVVYQALDVVDTFSDAWLGASTVGNLRHGGSDQHFQAPPFYLDNVQNVWSEVYGPFDRQVRIGPRIVL